MLVLAHTDYVFAARVEAAHGLNPLCIFIRRVDEAAVVNVDSRELGSDEKLLTGALFPRGQRPPNHVPERDLHVDCTEKACEVPLRAENHYTLEHAARYDVNAVCVVNRDLQRREDEPLI
jgi:hypothetical protein